MFNNLLSAKQPQQTQQQGFTLIEVMVALMILAIVAVTASKVSSGYLRTVDGMKTRTLASFVAENMATDLIINKTWLNSSQQKIVEEQGRQWQVVMTPKVLNPEHNDLQSVEINVSELLNNGTRSTGTGTTLSIMVTKPID